MSALGFLNLKSFHPSNKANQRRLWIAQEREKDRLRREAEAAKEVAHEQESRLLAQQAKNISGDSIESKSEMLRRKAGLMLTGGTSSVAPIDVVVSSSTRPSWSDVRSVSSHDNYTEQQETHVMNDGEDSGVSAGRKRRRTRRKKNNDNSTTAGSTKTVSGIGPSLLQQLEQQQQQSLSSGSVQSEANLHQLRFMYDAPPGLKNALEKEKEREHEQKQREQEEEEEERRRLENDNRNEETDENDSNSKRMEAHKEYVPKHLVPDAVKFPILKNAPVQGTYADNVKIKHKPFGIELRDVRCTRCGGYGHTNVDRECPMRGHVLDQSVYLRHDPIAVTKSSASSSSQNDRTDRNNDSNKQKEEKKLEEDAEALLNKMTDKEQKALLKKYKELRREEKRERKRLRREEREHKRRRHDDRDSPRHKRRRYDSYSSSDYDSH